MILIKLFYYVIFLTNYLISNNPPEIELSPVNYNPKTINYDISKVRKYEQIDSLDSYKAFRFLFPGNFSKYYINDNKLSSNCYWYSRYSFESDYKTGKIKIADNGFDSFEKCEDYYDKIGSSVYLDFINITSYLGELDFNDNGRKYKYLFYNTHGVPENCTRDCPGYLGFAKFLNKGKKWILEDFKPAISSFGFNGFSTMPYKIFKLSSSKTAFFIKYEVYEGIFVSDGYAPISFTTLILLINKNSVDKILDEWPSELDNHVEPLGTHWKSNIVIDSLNESNGLYNIYLERIGTYDPQNEPSVKFNYTKRKDKHDFRYLRYYKYNGKKYVLSKEITYD